MYSKLIDQLVTRKIIRDVDADLYLYGLRNGTLLTINILTMLIISLFFSKFGEMMVFLVSYAPLRHYCGGYHAKSAVRCYIISIIITLLVVFALNYIIWTSELCLLAAIISAIIILILAPVADANKPLDTYEIKIFKSIARTILAVQILVFLIFLKGGYNLIFNSMTLSFITITGMLIIGQSNRTGYRINKGEGGLAC